MSSSSHTNISTPHLISQQIYVIPRQPLFLYVQVYMCHCVCLCVCVKEPFKLQLRVFLEEVQQQIQIPTIRR